MMIINEKKVSIAEVRMFPMAKSNENEFAERDIIKTAKTSFKFVANMAKKNVIFRSV
jgi:hypothetical protein